MVAAIVAVVAVVGGVTYALVRSPSDQSATPKTSAGGSVPTHPGWTEYKQQLDGFAISLPPDWTETGLDLGAAIKFQAAANSGNASFHASMSVVTEDLPVRLSLADYVEVSVSQITTTLQGVTGLKTELITLPGVGDTERIRYHFALNNLTIASHQYVVLKDRTGYVLTFEVVVSDEDTSQPIFEGIAQTFYFLA